MGINYGRLAGFVFSLCCCLAVVSIVNVAFAATNTELMYGRMHGGNVTYKSAAQLRLEATYNHSFQKVPDQVARYVPKNKTFSVTYTQAQLRNMVKGVGKNTALYATVAGAVAAAGWVIDELTGQITKPSEPQTVFPDGGIYHRVSTTAIAMSTGIGGKDFASPQSFYNAAPQTFTHNSTTYVNPSFRESIHGPFVRYGTSTHPDSNSFNLTTTRMNCSTSPVPLCTNGEIIIDPSPQPVSDAEFDTHVLPKVIGMPNHQLESSLLRDTQGNPKITPELDHELGDWLQDIANRSPDLTYDPNTRSLTYTDPQTQEITEIQTQPEFDPVTDSTESNVDPKHLEWPSFCDWATIVCDLAEFIMGEPDIPDPEQMPFQNINLANHQEEFNSGFSSGSCPPPVPFSYAGYSGNYEFTVACYAAETYFKPILLTMAAIMAGFIIVGASRRAA